MNRLIAYLKNPFYCENRKPEVHNFLFLIYIYIASIIPIALVIFFVIKSFNIEHINNSDLSTNVILIGAFLAPIYEEVLFRSLLKFTKQNLILFITIVSVFIGYCAFNSMIPFVVVGISVFLITVILFVVFFSRKKVEHFISKNFKYFFYASSIIFGLLHASNFTGNIYVIIGFSFILGGPQIILGLILGFIRMNYGLVYSILFHLIINSTLLFSLFRI